MLERTRRWQPASESEPGSDLEVDNPPEAQMTGTSSGTTTAYGGRDNTSTCLAGAFLHEPSQGHCEGMWGGS